MFPVSLTEKTGPRCAAKRGIASHDRALRDAGPRVGLKSRRTGRERSARLGRAPGLQVRPRFPIDSRSKRFFAAWSPSRRPCHRWVSARFPKTKKAIGTLVALFPCGGRRTDPTPSRDPRWPPPTIFPKVGPLASFGRAVALPLTRTSMAGCSCRVKGPTFFSSVFQPRSPPPRSVDPLPAHLMVHGKRLAADP